MKIDKNFYETTKAGKTRVRQNWLLTFQQDGKQRRKQFKTKADAEKWYEREIENKAGGAVYIADAATVTIAKACDMWVEAGKASPNCSRGTVDQREQHCRLHITPHLGEKLVTKLTKHDVEAYTGKLLAGGMSLAMVRKVQTSLVGVLAKAIDNRLVGTNVALKAERPSTKRKKAPIRIPSEEVVGAMLRAANNLDNEFPEIFPALLLVSHTGLRSAELRGLAWPQLTLPKNGKAGSVEVLQTVDDRYTGEIVPTVKSAAGFRTIPIAPEVVEVLRKWKARCAPSPDNLVFPNGRGRAISESNWRDVRWLRIMRAVGEAKATGGGHWKPTFGVHALRHFYASQLIAANVDRKRITYWLGHATYAITHDIYGHLMVDEDKDHDIVSSNAAGLLAAMANDPEADELVEVAA